MSRTIDFYDADGYQHRHRNGRDKL